MRVAMLNRPPANQGGDRLALGYTIAALGRAGVDAVHVYGDNLAGRLAGYDLAHCFHLDFDWAIENYQAATQAGIPYVMTPIFYPELRLVPHVQTAQAVAGARAIFPFSRREGQELQQRFGPIAYTPIPNGTAPEFHAEPSPERIGVCACDWVGFKNAGTVELACAQLRLPFTVFRDVPHDRMAAEYRRFRVFASATPSDRMALAVGEALSSGCRAIVSTANRGNEWYPGLETIHPTASVADWKTRLRIAHGAPDWNWTPNRAARELTWDKAAEMLRREYARVLGA